MRASPSLAESLLLFLLFTGVVIVVAVVCLSLRVRLSWYGNLLLQLMIAWPLVLWTGLRWSRVSFRDAFSLVRFPVRVIPALLMASCGGALVLIHVASSIQVPWFRHVLITGLPPDRWMSAALAGVVVAPLAEEMFFRGLVLRGFVMRYRPFHAVWMSALFFSLFHLNLWQGILTFPMGLAYAWLVLRTGSVIPGIISHMMVNLCGMFLLVPVMQAFGYGVVARHDLAGRCPPVILTLAIILAAVGGYLVRQQLVVQTAVPAPDSQGTPP